jgi:hypothetical protein
MHTWVYVQSHKPKKKRLFRRQNTDKITKMSFCIIKYDLNPHGRITCSKEDYCEKENKH